jgi:hypothetical protein
MSITVDGLTLALEDYLGTSHTENVNAATGTETGESYPEEPLFPDRTFRLLQTLIDNGWNPQVVEVTATSKTLAVSDRSTIQKCNSASAQTLTIPSETDSPTITFPDHSTTLFMQKGSGQLTIQAESGVTLNGVSGGAVSIASQYGSAFILRDAQNAWLVAGALA